MGILRPWALALACGCAARLAVPDLDRFVGPVWPAAPELAQVAFVGSVSGPAGSFVRPVDVACGPDHMIAVADVGARRVHLLDLERRRAWNTGSAGGRPLEAPVGVGFGPDGLFAVDSARRTVFRAASGRLGLEPVAAGTAWMRPTHVLATPSHDLVVVDSGAHAVLRGPLGSDVLSPISSGRGPAGGGFNHPVRAALEPDGSILVADALNAVVQRVAEPTPQPVAGGHGRGGSRLVQPKGVAVDAFGRIHVVDAGMQHVQVYEHDGAWAGRYGQPGDGPGELALPGGLCIDGDGHVFVADSIHGRVQIYRVLGSAEGDP